MEKGISGFRSVFCHNCCDQFPLVEEKAEDALYWASLYVNCRQSIDDIPEEGWEKMLEGLSKEADALMKAIDDALDALSVTTDICRRENAIERWIIVIICSAFLFSEKITVKTLLALSAALIGAVLISWQGVQSGIDRFGLLLAILSAFAYAAMVILNKMSKNITGMQNATIQLTVTCVVVFLYVCVRNGLHITIPSESIVPVLWIGIINTGLGCFLYFSSISSLPAQTVSVCGYLEPLSAVLFSVLILHETMLPLQILGAVLILSGTMILNTKQKRQTTGRMTRQKEKSL